jgi:hypothetical protein
MGEGLPMAQAEQSNLPKLSARAKQALDVLADGGRFVHRLERNSYTGREQWQYRLARGLSTGIVRGIGLAAFHELQRAGLLAYCASEGTSVSSYYKLNTEA